MQDLIHSAVDRHRDAVLAAERYIWQNPETGYREQKTSRYMAQQFEALGYTLRYAEGITGFVTDLDTGREGPTVLVLGELDSVICPTHPEADPQPGAVHACGHNAQCATLLAIAAALREPGVTDDLCGRIRLCAVPAEELLEIEYRRELKKAGRIRYFGGKSEFLYRGLFDGVDLAFMVHSASSFHITANWVGCLAKNVVYKGKSAHAGGSPWNGNNALYAATAGLTAVNAVRETFKEKDCIRVHPIITKGGDMVNAIPAEVRMESYVRGSSFEAIKGANARVNRALCGAALSLGCNVEIVDIPGYAPHVSSPELVQLAVDAAAIALPGTEVPVTWEFATGSSDMGDLSCIMPIVQPHAGGITGTGHGADYDVTDPETACLKNAEWQLTMLQLLLQDGAARATDVLAKFKPQFESKEAYFAYVDALADEGDRITYNEDGTVQVRVN